MRQSLLVVIVLSIFLTTFVASEDVFLSALNEVETDVDRLVPLKDKVNFYNDYYEVTDLLKTFNFSLLWKDLNEGKADNKTCNLCNSFLGFAKTFLQNSELLKTLAHSLCKKLNFYSERVCDGLLTRLADPLTYILHNTKLSVPELCGVLLHPKCMDLLGHSMTKNVDWELTLPSKKEFKPMIGDESRMKMLHLTDVHLDLWYTAGSNSDCEEPLCCRSTTHGNNHSAGYWSETLGSCDTPLIFANKAIKHIGDTHKDIDFVIWTGDNVPHDVWNTTQEINLRHIHAVSGLVNVALDGKKVFPCLGNHETHPINMYVPNEVSKKTNFSNNWLYDTLANEYWSKWIQTESAKSTFKKGGYYSAMVSPKLKLIALNSNTCYRMNFWVAYDPVDPDGQLAWLIKELDEAETNGHYAMIIGHIPPSGDCYQAWIHNFIRINERYQHLITASYYGHTHKDELLVLYNKNKNNETIPVSMSYIGPSITTYEYLNPGYRIFTLNGNGKPVDFDVYYTDVIEDNKNGQNVDPKWHFEYSAKTAYKLDSLSLSSWDKFIKDSQTNDDLAKLYSKYYHRDSKSFEEHEEKENKNNIKAKRDLIQGAKFLNPFADVQ